MCTAGATGWASQSQLLMRSHAEVLVPPGGGDRLKVTPLGATPIAMFRADPTYGGRLEPACTTTGPHYLWLQHGDTLHLLLPRDGRRPVAYTISKAPAPAEASWTSPTAPTPPAAPPAAAAEPGKRARADAPSGGKRAKLPGADVRARHYRGR